MHLRSKRLSENKFGERWKGLRCLFFASISALFVLPTCNAQSPQAPVLVPQKDLQNDFADWPKIRQDIGFLDGKSMLVSDIAGAQVLVEEDGVQQTEAKLQKPGQSASICLVVDQSSSMKKSSKTLIAAIQRMIATADPSDEFAILAFDKSVYLEQDFTGDASKLEVGLKRIGFGGPSSFFDAVWVAMDQLATRAPERRRILVIFADGEDNYSHVSFGDLLKRLRSSSSPLVDAVGQSSQGTGLHNLQTLSEATGGFAFAPEHLDSWNDIADEINRDLRSRYRLEYSSSHSRRDGKLHKVEVRVSPGANAATMKPQFRREYYAPSH
jgi:VWFA-related protein